jgi:hypothetical protein
VSAGHKPIVDETVDDQAVEASSVERALDDDLDHVEPALDGVAGDVADVDEPPDGTLDDGGAVRARRGLKIVLGSTLALGMAAVAIWAAAWLGGSSQESLPLTVSDPSVVLGALEDGGIMCSGAAVSGEVATCNATVAVRVFSSPEAAESWVTKMLSDPLTSSAIGWVTHGNVVVAAPLNATPDVAAALGSESQIY